VTVRVCTDSAAALDDEQAASFGICIAPMQIAINGTAYADGELSDVELEQRQAEGVKTSSPAPGAFVSALDDAADGAVIVTVASRLSASHQAAELAASLVEGPVRVVDSRNAAGAQALVAIAAAQAVRDGADVDAAAAAAVAAAKDVRLVGTLGSLDRLDKSGRVPGIAGMASRMLGVHPFFELRRGHVRPLRPSLGGSGVQDRLVGQLRDATQGGHSVQVIVSHALAEEPARELLAAVQAEFSPSLALLCRFGTALLAHAGPGTIGLSWRPV
jgi:DegV family protein with EDD domain